MSECLPINRLEASSRLDAISLLQVSISAPERQKNVMNSVYNGFFFKFEQIGMILLAEMLNNGASSYCLHRTLSLNV